jgi:hypothetical protein
VSVAIDRSFAIGALSCRHDIREMVEEDIGEVRRVG